MIVGEVALQDLHRVVGYLESGDQLHLAHNFVFIDQDWDAETYADSIADFEALAEETAWPAWFLGQPRQAAARAAASTTTASARSAPRAILVMLYTLRGTPFIYQGEELGLPDAPIPPDRVVDVDGRDPERAPIPWTPEAPGHGFTTGERVAAVRRPRRRRSTPPPRPRTRARRCNLDARARAPARARPRRCQTGDAAPVRRRPGHPGLDARARTFLVAVNFTADELPLRRDGDAGALQRPGPRSGERLARDPSEALILRIT